MAFYRSVHAGSAPPHFVRPGDDGRNSTASARKRLARSKRSVNNAKRRARKPRSKRA